MSLFFWFWHTTLSLSSQPEKPLPLPINLPIQFLTRMKHLMNAYFLFIYSWPFPEVYWRHNLFIINWIPISALCPLSTPRTFDTYSQRKSPKIEAFVVVRITPFLFPLLKPYLDRQCYVVYWQEFGQCESWRSSSSSSSGYKWANEHIYLVRTF